MSTFVFGTTSLGIAYGLPDVGGKPPVLLQDEEARALTQAAYDRGIRTFDTAPAYGLAEERLGAFAPPEATIWTKVSRAKVASRELPHAVRASLASSRARLRRQSLACVQWHNFVREDLDDAGFLEAVASLRADPDVALLGATTYGRSDAIAAVESGLFSLVQIEWNLLNQGVLREVASRARARGVALALRSVLLQGVLTSEQRLLASAELRAAVDRASRLAASAGIGLTELAYRAALAQEDASWVLVGFRSTREVTEALAYAQAPGLSDALLSAIHQLDLDGDRCADPRFW